MDVIIIPPNTRKLRLREGKEAHCSGCHSLGFMWDLEGRGKPRASWGVGVGGESAGAGPPGAGGCGRLCVRRWAPSFPVASQAETEGH